MTKHLPRFTLALLLAFTWTGVTMAQTAPTRRGRPAQPGTPEIVDAVETPTEGSSGGAAGSLLIAAATADPESITLQLLDGSVVTGKLSLQELEVDTQFGKLKVPVNSIKSFTPGIGSHPEVLTNLKDLITKLGSNIFSEREASQKAILKMGPVAKPELQRFVDDTDTERRTRVKALLEEFDQQSADEEEDAKKNVPAARDTVETVDFTIVGKIVPSTFELATQFGKLTIKLSDIQRGQRNVFQKEDLRKTVAVQGMNLIQTNASSTGIRLEKGDKITISADGTIVMTPWGNQAIGTPEGAPNFGWYVPSRIAAGALVGRIGTNGPVFKVGSKIMFNADRAGVLFLAVGMEPNYVNNQFPGEYKVKIVVEKKN